MKVVLQQRDFARVWFAGLISMIGDWVLRIGLPLYVFKLTGSTLTTGVMVVAGIIPGLIFGSIAGVFVDRWDRKRIMIVTNLLQAGTLLLLLFVRSIEQVWIVYVVQFTASALSQFFTPAESALLPLLVSEEHLPSANSMSALNSNMARLLGSALAGIILGLTGLLGVTLIDAISFVLAAGLIATVSYRRPQPQSQALEDTRASIVKRVSGVGHELKEGLHVVLESPALTILFAAISLTMISEGFLGTLLVPFVSRVMHGSDVDFGFLMAAQAVGGIIGSLLIGRVAGTIPAYRLLGICSVVIGILDLALFCYSLLIPGIGLGLLIVALVGIPDVGAYTGRTTLLQTLTKDTYRGRVFGTLGALSALVMLVSAVLAGVLGDRVNLILLLTVDSLGYVLCGIVVLTVLKRKVVLAAQPAAD